MSGISSLDPKIGIVASYIEKCYNLDTSKKKRLLDRLWTFSSKVRQPRKDDRSCNKTPYFDRWDTNTRTSYLTPHDPRYATKQECEKILLKLLTLLLESSDVDITIIKGEIDFKLIEQILGRKLKTSSLRCIVTNETITKNDIKKALTYATQRLGTFNIPTGYIKRLDEGGLHRHDNVGWIKPLHINYKLREVLKQEFIKAGGNSKSAKNALDKIQVKAYCTDKFTMPPFFSNRDVRWATWSKSNQYASHYDCCMIELELMCQVFEFIGAPKLNVGIKQEIKNKRKSPIRKNSRVCYITGKELSFKTYLQSAISPKGGKSLYHVSHVKPLTRGGKHNYINVEWITEDGNRIQGNDTLQEIQVKLIDAVSYYVEKNNRLSSLMRRKLLKLKKLISSKIKK